jgi:hypothetical protein
MLQPLVLIREREINRPIAANTLKGNRHSFRGRISATQTIFQTRTSAPDPQLIDLQSDFKVCTEWPESTATEKTGQKREKTASAQAMEVNSSRPKSLLFQGALAQRPLPERRLQPLIVGGGRGTVVKPSPPRFQ